MKSKLTIFKKFAEDLSEKLQATGAGLKDEMYVFNMSEEGVYHCAELAKKIADKVNADSEDETARMVSDILLEVNEKVDNADLENDNAVHIYQDFNTAISDALYLSISPTITDEELVVKYEEILKDF